jgi:hypothetical protein
MRHDRDCGVRGRRAIESHGQYDPKSPCDLWSGMPRIARGIVRLTLRAGQCRMHTRRSRYLRHRFPSDIISHAVWLYHRYDLSFRESRICWPNEASSCRTNPFGSGARSSAQTTPGG